MITNLSIWEKFKDERMNYEMCQIEIREVELRANRCLDQLEKIFSPVLDAIRELGACSIDGHEKCVRFFSYDCSTPREMPCNPVRHSARSHQLKPPKRFKTLTRGGIDFFAVGSWECRHPEGGWYEHDIMLPRKWFYTGNDWLGEYKKTFNSMMIDATEQAEQNDEDWKTFLKLKDKFEPSQS